MATTKRFLVCLALLLGLWVRPASAAVATCTVGNSGSDNGGTTASVSGSFNAVGACSGTALLVQLEGDDHTDDVIGCTYNAANMTFINKAYGGGTGRYSYTYALLDPDPGSNTLTCTSFTSHYLFWTASSYSGVTGFGSSSGTGCTAVTQCTGNLTTTQANSWVFAGASGSNVSAWAGITNATLRGQYVPFSSPAVFDNATAIAASNYSMTVGTGATGDIALVMVELYTGAAPAGTRRLLLLGVGGA